MRRLRTLPFAVMAFCHMLTASNDKRDIEEGLRLPRAPACSLDHGDLSACRSAAFPETNSEPAGIIEDSPSLGLGRDAGALDSPAPRLQAHAADATAVSDAGSSPTDVSEDELSPSARWKSASDSFWGVGKPQDFVKAVEQFEYLAEKGDLNAKQALISIYTGGRPGVPPSPEKRLMWENMNEKSVVDIPVLDLED